MTKQLTGIPAAFLVILFLVLSPLQAASAHPNVSHPLQDELPTETPSPSLPTPAEVIAVVNNLRIARGLNALTTHPVLMEVAAQQASALAASEGAVGHERPCGMTLGQELLSRGYPLLGDLSMDGYRSENWVVAATVEEAISFWLSDDLHTNTMLSPDRSDIGAAVAIGDQYYLVLETALSTSSGQMQYDAYPILTGIPMTQAACYGMYTEAAKYGVSNQYAFPVIPNTALPNGDVVHEVKYGQALWTIAIQYKTTIAELKRLNHLTSDTIAPGQKLIVKTGATQPPADSRTPSPTPIPTRTFPWAVNSPVATSSPTLTAIPTQPLGETLRANSAVIAVLIISFSVLMAVFGLVGRKQGK